MKKTIYILLFLCSCFTTLYSQDTPHKTYKVMFYMANNGNFISDNTTLIVTTNRITIQKGESFKYWECEYKGIRSKQVDKDISFKYHYYLTKDNISLIISDYKEVKHNGTFYYRIVFNGQTLLAL